MSQSGQLCPALVVAVFYSREQRAKRPCLHGHLATAARVKYPVACCGVFDLPGQFPAANCPKDFTKEWAKTPLCVVNTRLCSYNTQIPYGQFATNSKHWLRLYATFKNAPFHLRENVHF